MKAVRIHQFGGPEVMHIEELERPVPAPDELLVKVYASGVNPVDWVIRNGANDALNSLFTLPMTLGWDAAGVVEELGSEVTGFQKGDAVYGIPNFPGNGNGSYADYCTAKATQSVVDARAIERQTIQVSPSAGVCPLQISTLTEAVTTKILKRKVVLITNAAKQSRYNSGTTLPVSLFVGNEISRRVTDKPFPILKTILIQ